MRHTISCAVLCLLWLCSCATERPAHLELPPDVTMNEAAGRGGFLIITLQMEDGQKLPFMVDTGTPVTLLDTSLESKLGKQIGTINVNSLGGERHKAAIYTAPNLYLGGVRLATGKKVFTFDFKPKSPASPMGILGFDCLRHYCIQLDFEAEKMRFLDPDKLDVAGLGDAFPMMFQGGYPFIHDAGLIGKGTNLLVDVGCTIDGLVYEGSIQGMAELLPQRNWDGGNYTNLVMAAPGHINDLGLCFLARNLVTFNFPKHLMYLKQTRSGPLAGDILTEMAHNGHWQLVEFSQGLEFLNTLKEQGQLPGLSASDPGTIYLEKCNDESSFADAKGPAHPAGNSGTGPKSVTIAFRAGSKTCHYTVIYDPGMGIWKLQKAWQTDGDGKAISQK